MAEDKSPLATVRDVAFVAAVYAFFTGFAYLYQLYQRIFGVGLGLLDVKFEQAPIFAYTVLSTNPRNLVLSLLWPVAIVGIGYLLFWWLGRRWLLSVGYALGALLLFSACNALAIDTAKRVAVAMRSSGILRTITFRFSDDFAKEETASGLLEENAEEQLLLLAETTESFFVLRQPPPGEATPTAFVHQIPRSAVRRSTVIVP